MRPRTVTPQLILLAAACSYQPTPVPVVGETALLEGEWRGTFASEQSGRTGSIVFHLKAGTDSAHGDVVMIPARHEAVAPATLPQSFTSFSKPPRLLRISFVRCEDGEVTGRLDPYEDPETGELVYTTFAGRLRREVFQGTFSSYYPARRAEVGGTWSVKRQKPR